MPGILGGLISAMAILAAADGGDDIYEGGSGCKGDQDNPCHFYWSYSRQAATQIGALVVTLVISIVGGLLTGFAIKRVDINNPFKTQELFNDYENFDLPDESEIPTMDQIKAMTNVVITKNQLYKPKKDKSSGAGKYVSGRHGSGIPGPPPMNASGNGYKYSGGRDQIMLHDVQIQMESIRLNVAQPHPIGLFGLAIGCLLSFMVALGATGMHTNIQHTYIHIIFFCMSILFGCDVLFMHVVSLLVPCLC